MCISVRAWIHADRTAGCDRHHCDFDRAAFASRSTSSRIGAAFSVQEQSEAIRHRVALVRRGNEVFPAGIELPELHGDKSWIAMWPLWHQYRQPQWRPDELAQ